MMIADAYDKVRTSAGLASPTCTFHATDVTSSAEARTFGAEACEGNVATESPNLGGRSLRPGGASTGSDASQGGAAPTTSAVHMQEAPASEAPRMAGSPSPSSL